MKNTIHQKGFTVLEVIVALLLFSLLMGSLWQFYGETYRGYISFDQQADLSEQSRLVTNFIREEIRLSDQVTIEVWSGSEKKYINFPSESSDSLTGDLSEILLNTKAGTSTQKGDRKIKLVGESLYYEANHVPSLISDKVDNIKVIKETDSPIIQFECTYAIKKNGTVIQSFQNTFSESLQYKMPYPVVTGDE